MIEISGSLISTIVVVVDSAGDVVVVVDSAGDVEVVVGSAGDVVVVVVVVVVVEMVVEDSVGSVISELFSWVSPHEKRIKTNINKSFFTI